MGIFRTKLTMRLLAIWPLLLSRQNFDAQCSDCQKSTINQNKLFIYWFQSTIWNNNDKKNNLERHVNRIELYLLIHHLNFQFDLVECLRYCLQLANGVMDKSTTFASIMKMDSTFCFIIAEIGRCSQPS